MATSKQLLIITVLISNAVAFGLAVAAEFKRKKGWAVADEHYDYEYCVYGSDIASGFGAGAFLLIMASQVVFFIVPNRHLFCRKPSSCPELGGGPRTRTATVIVLSTVCWVCFFAAEACLLVGSVRNAYRSKYRTMFGFDASPRCVILRRGVFAAGAGFILITTILSGFYYVRYFDDYSVASKIQPSETEADDVKETQTKPIRNQDEAKKESVTVC